MIVHAAIVLSMCGACVSWSAMIKVELLGYVTTVCASDMLSCSARVCTVCEISRVLLRISIWFLCHFAGFHVANRAVTLLLPLRRCMESFSAFLAAYAIALANQQRVSIAFFMTRLVYSADQLCALKP